MDEAGRSQLLRLAESMAAARGLFASRDVAEILRAIDALDRAEAERDAARAEAARLREALEWYGDPEHWESVRYYGDEDTVPGSWEDDPGSPEDDNCDPIFPRWVPDCGTRARAALAAATSEDA